MPAAFSAHGVGFCAPLSTGSLAECQSGAARQGAWYDVESLSHCAQRCGECARCNFVSFSRPSKCGWYADCNLGALVATGAGAKFRTLQVPPMATNVTALLHLPPPRAASSDGTFHHFARALAAPPARQLRIAVYGTSVTDGLYPRFLERQLRHRFPRANLSVTAHAYPGATLGFMRHCVDSMLPARDADLYILEQWAGDHCTRGGEEGILALLASLQRRPAPASAAGPGGCGQPALMMLSTLDQNDCVRKLKRMAPYEGRPRDAATLLRDARECAHGGAGEGATSPMERIAARRGIPWVSMRLALRARLVESSARFGGPVAVVSALIRDYLHPSVLGHKLLAELIVSELSLAAEATRRPRCSPPLPGSDGGATHCSFGEALKAHVLQANGWAYRVERNKKGRPKPGLIANSAGASLDLCYPLPAALPVGGQAVWNFAYLRSYQHMGKVAVECTDGCACEPRAYNGHALDSVWPFRVSVAQVSYGQTVTREAWPNASAGSSTAGSSTAGSSTAGSNTVGSCSCTIRLTVLEETDSGEHKVKIVGLLGGFGVGGTVNDAIAHAYGLDATVATEAGARPDGGAPSGAVSLGRHRRAAHHDGYCAVTTDGDAGDCQHGDKGSFPLEPESFDLWSIAHHRCVARCSACARCRFVSISVFYKDCSWFHDCSLGQLRTKERGFRTWDLSPG
jgi:hypothetical protein